VDLIAPRSREEVEAALAKARDGKRPLLVVGGRTHLDKGNPSPVDAELDMTGLDRVIEHHPAEMLVVVEAGMRCGRLDQLLAEHGQEWPVDAPPDATVGGVIAAAASSPRRLRVGPVRDLVLEVELVTGGGRWVRAGGRTVKNVSGYDLCRLFTGSLGTLGVIVQAALKLRPRPRARRTIVAKGDLGCAAELLRVLPRASAALVTSTRVELRLEGWPEDVEEETRRAVELLGGDVVRGVDDRPFPPALSLWSAPVVAEVAVAPSKLPAVVQAVGRVDGPPGPDAIAGPNATAEPHATQGAHASAGPHATQGPNTTGDADSPTGAWPTTWAALAGVGICWVGLNDSEERLDRLREAVAELGGIAPVVRGPGGLGAPPQAPIVQQRLKYAFDPAGVLAPGRFWGGL
jgi:glycolate oxidase FAD binding subunit